MNTDLNAESAMTALQSTKIAAPAKTGNAAAAGKVAQEFEGVFISQMLNEMFEGVATDDTFGGGPGEDMFRSLMVDEYGKQIAAQGGIGLGQGVMRELISMQERAS
jgi:peptidoglycan hydrolase FlgJ